MFPFNILFREGTHEEKEFRKKYKNLFYVLYGVCFLSFIVLLSNVELWIKVIILWVKHFSIGGYFTSY